MSPSRRSVHAALGAACGFALVGLSLTGGATYAAFTDHDSRRLTAGAGVWAPDPPQECAEILRNPATTVVWGTMGDDVLIGGNHPRVLMGLGGDDVLYAGNQGDCLVGGDGDDRLIGDNAKDVLLGGAGNDHLDGGNAKDDLDGGADTDTCLGGNGKDTVVNCEPAARTLLMAPLQAPAPVDDPEPAPEPQPAAEPATAPETAPEPEAATPEPGTANLVVPPTEEGLQLEPAPSEG